MMWLWVGNGFVYMMCSLISGHWRRRWLPLSLRALWHDIHQTLTLNLRHTSHQYNAIQKVMYFGVMVLGILMALSGLAIWKPVQLFWLTNLFGGFATARYPLFGDEWYRAVRGDPRFDGIDCAAYFVGDVNRRQT